MSQSSGPTGSPQEIEAQIALRRERLAATVDELVARTKPKVLAETAVNNVKAKFYEATHTETGELRTERIAAVGAATLAVIMFIGAMRRRNKRRRRKD